jgi:hypothetical protein
VSVTEEERREREREVLGKLGELLIARRMAAPAILVLESVKPLSFIASQALIFLGPLAEALLPYRDYQVLAEALESRENVEWLIRRLEQGETKPHGPGQGEEAKDEA